MKKAFFLAKNPRNKNMLYNREENNNVPKNTLLYFFIIGGNMKESEFQKNLIYQIKALFPGCIVMKNDPNYIQGIPDLIILYENKWAALECKRSATASHRPNQEYYISLMDDMSFAAFVFPENREEILNELEQALRPRRKTRLSKR